MISKKGLGILGTLFLSSAVVLAGCSSGKEAAKTSSGGETGATPKGETAKKAENHTLKVANFFGADHPLNAALREKFKPLVEQKSGGTLKVEIYENNKLGAEKEVYDGVRNGTIEMGIVSTIMSTDVEKLQIGDWPFLYKDLNHAKKVWTGAIGKDIAADMEKKGGVHVLAWAPNGVRAFSSNKPVKKIEDFKGLRLRMPNNPNYINLGKALGANVTPLPLSEVFTALEQKVVDGQDNPVATLRANGWYEVQTDVLESAHIVSPLEYIIGGKLWGKLTPEQQQVIQEAATETSNYHWDLYQKSLEDDKKFLEGKGVKFTTPDEKLQKDMEAAVKPLYDDIYKKYPWAQELVEKIKKEAN